MSNSVGWNINELGQLSLFGEMTLNSKQLKSLPPHIYKGILKGYSEVLNQMQLPDNLLSLRFAARTDANGVIWIQYDGVEQMAGNLTKYPALHKAMCDAHTVAKIHFSSAFRGAPEIALPSPEIYAVQLEKPLLPPTGELAEIGLDVNGTVRNLSTVLSTASVALEFIAISGLMSGVTVVWAATRGMMGANKKYTRASEINDPEGKVLAGIAKVNGVVRGLAGMTQIAGSVGATLRNVAKLPISAAATKGMQYAGIVGSVCGLLRAALIMGSTMYEWPQLSAFREKLHWVLKSNISQQQKALEGLGFLQQQLTLTAEDLKEINDLGLEDADKETAIAHKIEEKRDRLVRKVGEDLVKEIENCSGDLIERLQASDPDALEVAKGLIEQVDRASFIKRVKQITLLAICTITIAATIVGMVFSGPVGPILFVVTNLLWLSVDSTWLHEKIGSAVHHIWQPGANKVWGNSQQRDSDQFWGQLEGPYVGDIAGQRAWNLGQLKAAVDASTKDLQRQYTLNGKHITSFDLACEELGLAELDFDRPALLLEEGLSDEQKAGLQWLTTFAGELLAPSEELFSDKVTPGEDAHIEATGRLIVEMHYNRERGDGMLRASQKADYPLYSAKHSLALRLDIHSADHVHAGWSGHGANWPVVPAA